MIHVPNVVNIKHEQLLLGRVWVGVTENEVAKGLGGQSKFSLRNESIEEGVESINDSGCLNGLGRKDADPFYDARADKCVDEQHGRKSAQASPRRRR